LKTSISNLAWNRSTFKEIAPQLKNIGMDGIEIAPTAFWEDLNTISPKLIRESRMYLADIGLKVSGIQSLFYGYPEFQLFDRSQWPKMNNHLGKMFELGDLMGADVAVFGSPKNRIRGSLNLEDANEIATEFFSQLIPILEKTQITLTLEPNAPQYGADYLLSYSEVVQLSKRIGHARIVPQIDTGCLWMFGEDPAHEFLNYTPHHIHLSSPFLGEIPGELNFDQLISNAKKLNYENWLVLETLSNPLRDPVETARWLVSKLKEI